MVVCSVFLFLAIFGVGGQWNSIYMLMEARMPPEKQGDLICVFLTFSTISTSFATQLAYLAYPIPYYIMMSLIFVAVLFVYWLPEPMNHIMLQEVKQCINEE